MLKFRKDHIFPFQGRIYNFHERYHGLDPNPHQVSCKPLGQDQPRKLSQILVN